MKDNNIPRAERLRDRIAKLQYRKDLSRKPMNEITGSKGHRYWGCVDCYRADPQLSSEGHTPYCQYKGIDKQIAHYSKLLEEEVQCQTSKS